MAEMKKTEAYAFLREVDSVALQQSLRHLDTAFQNFFKQPKTGFPKFKSKKQNKKSYSTICINGNIAILNGYLKLPKAGQVRLKQHRAVPKEYKLKSVTVSQKPGGKYYASILFAVSYTHLVLRLDRIRRRWRRSPEKLKNMRSSRLL